MNQEEKKETEKISTKPKKINPKIIGLIVFLCIFLGVIGYFIYQRYFDKDAQSATGNVKKSSKIANNLDGIAVDPDLATRHPLAIMIENHPDSRPQTGLDKAAIVYEAITEGGITRFMAVYGPYEIDKVGPVRSARTYFIDWVAEFKAFYAHCGGNLDALDKIKADNILDLDQFSLGETAYWREPERGKATEHTMYTSAKKLYEAAKAKNWPQKGDFTPLKFAENSSAESPAGSSVSKITINFSTPTYLVHWDYDQNTKSFLRSMSGTKHVDKTSGEQLKALNIIIQEVNRWESKTSINESGYAMQTTGEGKAKIITGGKFIDGTWKKTDQKSRTKFYDSSGTEIIFTPGKFWIEIVPPEVYSSVKIDQSPPAVQ